MADSQARWMPASEELHYCCHCGMCVAMCPHGALRLDKNNYPALVRTDACVECGFCKAICPGVSIDFPILEDCFLDGAHRNALAGQYERAYLGRDPDDEAVLRSSSGGVVSALVVHALATGLAEASVGAAFTKPAVVAPRLVTSAQDIEACRQSKYQVAPVCSVLRHIPEKKRVIFVGTGCQVTAVRKLQTRSPQWRERIPLIIGIFCGGAGNLAPQAMDFLFRIMGTRRQDVASFAFRDGPYPGQAHAILKDGSARTLGKESYKWLYILFTEERCINCPDLASTLADVSVGDAFGVTTDPMGQSGLIVRSSRGQQLVDGAAQAGRVRVDPVPIEQLVAAQPMNFYVARWSTPKAIRGRKPHLLLRDEFVPPPGIKMRFKLAMLRSAYAMRRIFRTLFSYLPSGVFRFASRWSGRRGRG